MDKEKEKTLEEEIIEEVADEQETEEISETLEKRAERLEGEVNTWKTDYYKVFADMDNLKRRMQTEHSNAMKFMMQSFVEELLPIVDNLERALNVVEPSEDVKSFLKGYEMIYQQFLNVLEKNGVKVIETKGQAFDPNFHQAVMSEANENFESNMIIEELQKGYTLKDRVVRASLVKVSE